MVEQSAEELPLEETWTWYAHLMCGSQNYSSSYIKLGSFATVSDFWRYYNNLPLTHIYHGQLFIQGRSVNAFSVFRSNIIPEWEDPANLYGSEWVCREYMNIEDCSSLWQDFLLAAIGEKIPCCNGIRFINKSKSNRTHNLYKVEMWLSSSEKDIKMLENICGHMSKRFAFMLHCDKHQQAIDYYSRRRRP